MHVGAWGAPTRWSGVLEVPPGARGRRELLQRTLLPPALRGPRWGGVGEAWWRIELNESGTLADTALGTPKGGGRVHEQST